MNSTMNKLIRQIEYWQKDGHFNFDLYLAFCKAKLEHYENTNTKKKKQK